MADRGSDSTNQGGVDSGADRVHNGGIDNRIRGALDNNVDEGTNNSIDNGIDINNIGVDDNIDRTSRDDEYPDSVANANGNANVDASANPASNTTSIDLDVTDHGTYRLCLDAMEDIQAYQQWILDGTAIENNISIPDNAFALLTWIRYWRLDQIEDRDAQQAAEDAIYDQDEFQALKDLEVHLSYLEQNWDTALDGRKLVIAGRDFRAEVAHLGPHDLESQHERLNGVVEGLEEEYRGLNRELDDLTREDGESERVGGNEAREGCGAGNADDLEASNEKGNDGATKETEAQEETQEGDENTEQNAQEMEDAKARARARMEARAARKEEMKMLRDDLNLKIEKVGSLKTVLREKLRELGKTPQEDKFEKAKRERKERLDKVWTLEEDADNQVLEDTSDESEEESNGSEQESPVMKQNKDDAGERVGATSNTGAKHGEEDDGSSDSPSNEHVEEGTSSFTAGHFVHQRDETPSTPRGNMLPAINHMTMCSCNVGASEPIGPDEEHSSSDEYGVKTPDSDSDDIDLEAAPDSTATQDDHPPNTPAEGDVESGSNASATERLGAVQRALEGVKLDDGEAGRDLSRADN